MSQLFRWVSVSRVSVLTEPVRYQALPPMARSSAHRISSFGSGVSDAVVKVLLCVSSNQVLRRNITAVTRCISQDVIFSGVPSPPRRPVGDFGFEGLVSGSGAVRCLSDHKHKNTKLTYGGPCVEGMNPIARKIVENKIRIVCGLLVTGSVLHNLAFSRLSRGKALSGKRCRCEEFCDSQSAITEFAKGPSR